MSKPALRRKVLVRVAGPVGIIRARNALGDLGQVAIYLQLGLLISLSRGSLGRSVIRGGSFLRFHLRSPPCQLCERSWSQ